MDWARAVEINRTALTRIVAELFALLGMVSGGPVERLPHAVYLAAGRLLRPTESALRRLIVIAARGLVVKPLPKRPALKRSLPKAVVMVSKESKPLSFRLFDKRVTYDFIRAENPLFVKVKTYTRNPFNLFDRMYQPQPEKPDGRMKATHLSRRLAAVVHALETLPSQAQRLARWTARRKNLESPKFTSPLRPGPPPGHRQKPKVEIDFVLRECHALAWDSLREDSS